MIPSINLYKDGSEVEASLGTGSVNLLVIMNAPLMAERKIILMPFISPDMDSEMAYTILFIIEICVFYDSILDIEQFLHSVLAETICGYLPYFVCLVWSLIHYRNTDVF